MRHSWAEWREGQRCRRKGCLLRRRLLSVERVGSYLREVRVTEYRWRYGAWFTASAQPKCRGEERV